MAEDKKITDGMIDDELDKVAGGTIVETAADSFDLYRRGLVEDMYVGSRRTRKVINMMGYKYGDKGGLFQPNEYFDRLGNPVDRGTFWENFDKEHQTEAVPVVDAIREKMAENVQESIAREKVLCPV